MYADADLYSVKAHIADWSMPGAVVYGVLYEEDLAQNNCDGYFWITQKVGLNSLSVQIRYPFRKGEPRRTGLGSDDRCPPITNRPTSARSD